MAPVALAVTESKTWCGSRAFQTHQEKRHYKWQLVALKQEALNGQTNFPRS